MAAIVSDVTEAPIPKMITMTRHSSKHNPQNALQTPNRPSDGASNIHRHLSHASRNVNGNRSGAGKTTRAKAVGIGMAEGRQTNFSCASITRVLRSSASYLPVA